MGRGSFLGSGGGRRPPAYSPGRCGGEPPRGPATVTRADHPATAAAKATFPARPQQGGGHPARGTHMARDIDRDTDRSTRLNRLDADTNRSVLMVGAGAIGSVV